MEDCNVCVETYTKTTRKEVKCPYCEFSACLICFKKYLLESSKPPACMNCGREYDAEYLSTVTPNSFHNNQLRNKLASDLMSTEKSLLPNTQHLVEAHKQKLSDAKEIDALQREKHELKLRIKEIELEQRRIRYGGNQTKPAETERKTFIMRCSQPECRGFLSTAWKCGTCDQYSCPECHQPKNGKDDPDHVCNPDDVETAKLIAKDTKPCPGCQIPIFKISGCDLMWCVECHVTWSWKKNEIVKVSHNHNPHFYQYQRDTNGGVAPRVPGDNPAACCREGMPYYREFYMFIRQTHPHWKSFENAHRIVGHIRDIIIPMFPLEIAIDQNADLRVKFLMKQISEETWTKELKKRQKKAEKDRAIRQVLDMMVNTMTDTFRMYMDDPTEHDIENELNHLREYVNRQMANISHRFKNKTMVFSESWKH